MCVDDISLHSLDEMKGRNQMKLSALILSITKLVKINGSANLTYSDFIDHSRPGAGCGAGKTCDPQYTPVPYTTSFWCDSEGPCNEGSGWWRNNNQICTTRCKNENLKPTYDELICIDGNLHPTSLLDSPWESSWTVVYACVEQNDDSTFIVDWNSYNPCD